MPCCIFVTVGKPAPPPPAPDHILTPWQTNVTAPAIKCACRRSPGSSQPSASSGAVHGNQRSHIYHLATCPDYEKVSENNRVLFQTEVEAQQAGYRKAGNYP